MIKGPGIKARHQRNLLRKMDEGFEGPMACLSTYVVEKKRIRVSLLFVYNYLIVTVL